MESTGQTVAAQPQMSSAPPTSYAPSAVSQPVMSQPQAYQASTGQPAQFSMAQHPAYQAAAPAVPASAAPAAQANPWQQAFQALSSSLNTSSPYQAPASPSAYQATPTPQAATQANWGSMAPQAAPTYSPQASTQGYSESEVTQLVQRAAQQGAAQAQDGYLSGISDQSLEVLEHFGAEAPALLNQYACAVEDALIEQVQRGNSMNHMLTAAGEERGAMNIMLTNPDVLADYVNEFFGPNGPYPTDTPEEAAQRQQMEARAQFEAEIQAQEQGRVPQQFQRPYQEMPTPGRQVNQANDFWGSFSEMMDSSPENAWKYLSQAPQGALQAKALVQDL